MLVPKMTMIVEIWYCLICMNQPIRTDVTFWHWSHCNFNRSTIMNCTCTKYKNEWKTMWLFNKGQVDVQYWKMCGCFSTDHIGKWKKKILQILY
jgi:hypothetical protein